ncbi:hypothetical protein D3C84_751990 [compost metagenome]
MDQPERNLGQKIVTQERPQALPGGDQYDQQRHSLQELQIFQVRNIREQHCLRVAQAIDEILENPGQHWLGGGEDDETEDTQHKNADIGFHIAQQPEVDFQAGAALLLRL